MKLKKTFDEWISGFEERYTPRQIAMFRDVWNTSVKIREIEAEYLDDETEWDMHWINEVATEIGK